MARKIIIQERIGEPSDFNFRYVFWADVPSARQSFYADATKATIVKDATAGEKTAITSGAVLELSNTAMYISGTSLATIKADLISKFNAYQTSVTNTNPWQYYGSSWDGSVWSAGGAA